MPSDTFFRLPAAKRETLLRCARAEFARVPYPDASINRIIRAAGIPRGSYYMYFTDKADLFSYLMDQYARQFSEHVARLLDERAGNLFEMLPALFDFLQEHYRTQDQDGTLEEISTILRRNAGLPHSIGQKTAGRALEVIMAHLDTSPLILRGEGDAEDILRIVMVVTVPLICEGLTAEDPSAVRSRYLNILAILKRGMAKEPLSAVSQS